MALHNDSAPPARLTEAAAWRVASRLALLVFALLLMVWLAVQLRDVLIQLLLGRHPGGRHDAARRRVYRQRPIRRWRWRPQRALVVLLLYLLLVLLIALIGGVVLPPLVSEVEDLAHRLPLYLQSVQSWIEALPLRYSLLPALNLSRAWRAELRLASSQLTNLFGQALVVIRLAIGLLSGALNGIFTLILALYMTADSKRILDYGLAFLPIDRQPQALRIARPHWAAPRRLGPGTTAAQRHHWLDNLDRAIDIRSALRRAARNHRGDRRGGPDDRSDRLGRPCRDHREHLLARCWVSSRWRCTS